MYSIAENFRGLHVSLFQFFPIKIKFREIFS